MEQQQLTPALIKSAANRFSLEIVIVLQLPVANIKDISALSECINLSHLDLAYNQVTRTKDLQNCTQLTYLNLTNNKISRVEGLSSCLKLRTVELQGNMIADFKFQNEFKNLEKLTSLYFQNFDFSEPNPICSESGYRGNVLLSLPQLKNLDGHRKKLPFIDKQNWEEFQVDEETLNAELDSTPWVKPISFTQNFRLEDSEFTKLLSESQAMISKSKKLLESVN